MPIKVLWGTQDRVLPTRQAHKLPGVVATHIFERTGHMLHLEAAQGSDPAHPSERWLLTRTNIWNSRKFPRDLAPRRGLG